jgi:hypothetical protein
LTTIKDIKTLTREEISEENEEGENYSKIIDAFIDESHRWNKKSRPSICVPWQELKIINSNSKV